MSKRILCIAPHLSTGGCPQYLYKKLTYLVNKHKILVVEYANVSDEYIVQKEKIKNLVGTENLITLGNNKSAEIELILNTFKPNIVHLEELNEYFLDDDSCKLIFNNPSWKVIETSHDSSFDLDNKRYLPDKFVFVSRYQIEHFAPLKVQTELVEYPLVRYQKDKNRAQSLLNISPNKFNIINVGLFTSRKNQAELITIAQNLVHTHPDIVFHFIGNQAPNFESYWKPLLDNLPNNCKIWGERNDVDLFYKAADAFYFASKGTEHDKETNPLVIREAISYNLPTLIRNLPVYKNMYHNVDNVYYITDNLESNTNLILSLYKQWELREKQNINMEKEKFTASWNGEENRVYFQFDELSAPNIRVTLKDIESNLVVYSYVTDIQPRINYWIIPIANVRFASLNNFRGFKLEFFNGDNLIQTYDLVINNSAQVIDNFQFVTNNLDPVWYGYYQIFNLDCYKSIFKDNKIKTVIDVGANNGVFTRYALKMGASKVFSIEPDIRAFNYLTQTFKNTKEVQPIQIGIGAKDGEDDFYSSNTNSTLSSFYSEQTEKYPQINGYSVQKIQTLTLTSYIKSIGLSSIDLVKIDIEGLEYSVLENTDDNTLSKIKNFIIELHHLDKNKQKSVELIERLKRLNYSIDYYDLFGKQLDENNLEELNFILCKKKIVKQEITIKAVHMLSCPETEREKKSISSISQLADYGIEYIQVINAPYKKLPPADNCSRPNDISMEPGYMKLTPGHYGNYKAHDDAILNRWEENLDALLIFECDAVITVSIEEFVKQVKQAIDECEKFKIRMFSFGPAYLIGSEIDMGTYFITNQIYELHAYLITKSNYNVVQNKLLTSPWDVFDVWVSDYMKGEKLGVLKNHIALQAKGYSLLDKKNSERNWLGIEKV